MRPISPALSVALVFAAATATQAQETRALELEIDGLFCEICARTLEDRLGAVDGVAEVKVDFRTGRGLLALEDGVALDEASLTALIEAYGFRLLGVEEVEAPN